MEHSKKTTQVHIIGGGLAGSEAAMFLANRDIEVKLHEMRPVQMTGAHKSALLGELVCSNSFRCDDYSSSAIGLLHQEMRIADSFIMRCAEMHKVPAGNCLAVDREGFAQEITKGIESHPNIEIIREEVASIPADWQHTIIATGPLTSKSLFSFLNELICEDNLYFYDSIAPILYKDSINMDICWRQSRYDKIGSSGSNEDYINCPMDVEQYNNFVEALLKAEKTSFHEFEKPIYFDGCLPIEVMAERGRETLRFGPMKPRGLTNKHNPDIKPYAVVQLRQDNSLDTLYNMVGFQTKLKHSVQKDIFRMIPGLENARFARLGGIHRNTFLNSPKILNRDFTLKNMPNMSFAGQIIGCEGYVESAAMGWLSALFCFAKLKAKKIPSPPNSTAFGSLHNHITAGHLSNEKNSFQPMNVNFGLFAPIEGQDELSKKQRLRGGDKKAALAKRALDDFNKWMKEIAIK